MVNEQVKDEVVVEQEPDKHALGRLAARYYVRGNSRSKRTRIHREDCRYYRPLIGVDSQWYGPYETIGEAKSKAREFAGGPRLCKVCTSC